MEAGIHYPCHCFVCEAALKDEIGRSVGDIGEGETSTPKTRAPSSRDVDAVRPIPGALPVVIRTCG
jgi:hypothetical protein